MGAAKREAELARAKEDVARLPLFATSPITVSLRPVLHYNSYCAHNRLYFIDPLGDINGLQH